MDKLKKEQRKIFDAKDEKEGVRLDKFFDNGNG